MKIRILITTIALLTLIANVSAQKAKIFVAPFKYAGKDIRQLLPQFRAAVITGVNFANRLDMIECQDSSIQPAKLLQAARDAKADYILQCELDNHNLIDILNVVKLASDAISGEKYPSGTYDKLTYSVKITRVEDEIIIDSRRLANTGYGYGSIYCYSNANNNATSAAKSISSALIATDNAMYWVANQMGRYIESIFPIEARIVKVENVTKDKVKSVYIDLGSESSVHTKLIFRVCICRQVAGETVFDNIGQIVVDEIKGANRSICKVKKGGKEIYQALQNQADVLLISEVKL